MERLSAFAFSFMVLVASLTAQTSSIIVFSESGEKFTLVVDGDVKNPVPAARVVATEIKNETPMVAVNFEDPKIPSIKQNGWMEFGTEYTLRITMNKKGERVLRMQGQAPLGTAKTGSPEKPAPTDFVEDAPAPASNGEVIATDFPAAVHSTTTVTTTEGTTGQNVAMNVGINGMSMNVNVNDGMGGTSTTTTTTTTTTHAPATTTAPVVEEPTATATTGCHNAMAPSDFDEAQASIKGKGFEDTKLTLAKQIGSSNCFSSTQVRAIMGLFGFEDSKLDFAKFAYDHVMDPSNYYKVNDAFGFSSSVDELNKYIQAR